MKSKDIMELGKMLDNVCKQTIARGLEIRGQLFLSEKDVIKHKFTIE